VPSDPSCGIDPSAWGEVEVRAVQPFQATKRYTCPGCGHAIEAGTGHLVAVPTAAPELRRLSDRRRPGVTIGTWR
jgi:hypothetical protein